MILYSDVFPEHTIWHRYLNRGPMIYSSTMCDPLQLTNNEKITLFSVFLGAWTWKDDIKQTDWKNPNNSETCIHENHSSPFTSFYLRNISVGLFPNSNYLRPFLVVFYYSKQILYKQRPRPMWFTDTKS